MKKIARHVSPTRVVRWLACAFLLQAAGAHASDWNVQRNVGWGLDRIDQRSTQLDGTYRHVLTGAGVHVYVVDSGIDVSGTQAEFAGRATIAWTHPDICPECTEPIEFSSEHGTQVAGVIGSRTYGVAKEVTLHSVQWVGALDPWTSYFDFHPERSAARLTQAVEWVTANHQKPAVANLSGGVDEDCLGYADCDLERLRGLKAQLDEAIRASVAAGVTWVVATQNADANHCATLSPARVEEVITVSATTFSNGLDVRGATRGFGPCIDLFAPGENVPTIGSNDQWSPSGTSYAAPHVTGAAALYLQMNPSATPAEVQAALVAYSTKGVISNAGANTPNRLLFAGVVRPGKLAAGELHSLAVKQDGSLWSWGDNGFGQLGYAGPSGGWTVPHRLGPARWLTVAAGRFHSVGVQMDGSLWAWGDNAYGQLGDGTYTSRMYPTRIGTSSDWVAVSAGDHHTLGLRADGTLWAWGRNQAGQLGDGSTRSRPLPVEIRTQTGGNAPDHGWASVSAGGAHTLASRIDGTVWGWGDNTYGQVGEGTFADRVRPAQLPVTGMVVAAGARHSLAIDDGDQLLVWGDNSRGAHGDTRPTSPSPSYFTVSGVGQRVWLTASAGDRATFAVDVYPSMWTAGMNADGQLANGTTADRALAIGTYGYSSWGYVAARRHVLATAIDGSLWAWGDNASGQLGDGTQADRTLPTRIGTATDWGAHTNER